MSKISQRGKTTAKRSAAMSPDASSAKHPSTAKWTFLTNHAHVLVLLHRDPERVLREVALEVGITERAVQRIIQELEAEGFIERERVGRRNRYQVCCDKPLRHPVESHRKIGDLLRLTEMP